MLNLNGEGFSGWEQYGPGGPVDFFFEMTPQKMISKRVGMADAYAGSLLWGDYRFEMTVKARAYGSPHAGVRIFFRLSACWEGYGILVGGSGTSLDRFEGSYSECVHLGSSEKGLKVGEIAQYAIEVSGNHIRVFRDGEMIIEAQDPDHRYAYGYIGVRTELSDMEFSHYQIQGLEVTNQEFRQRAEKDLGPPISIPQGEMMRSGGEETNGAREILLVYEQHGSMFWQTQDALPYVAYLDQDLRPVDWFFDTFLFVACGAPGGKNFGAGEPALMPDWLWWLDRIFHLTQGIAAFNCAVRQAGQVMGDDQYKAKVSIMIPYPFGEKVFGVVAGEELIFSAGQVGMQTAAQNRLKAVKWYIDEVQRRWNEAGYDRLELIGLYWNHEELSPTGIDYLYIPQVSEYIRGLGYRLSWIPWYKAPGFREWKRAGIDAVMMQPNYMFSKWISRSRLEGTAAEAKRWGIGVEMEASHRILVDPVWRERYYDYLRAAVDFGFAGDVLRGWYQDVCAFGQAARSEDPEVREVYDRTYQFVKGLYHEGFGV